MYLNVSSWKKKKLSIYIGYIYCISAGLNVDDPELSFDLNKFKRMSKDHDQMPIKIKELLRKKVEHRTNEENANVCSVCLLLYSVLFLFVSVPLGFRFFILISVVFVLNLVK